MAEAPGKAGGLPVLVTVVILCTSALTAVAQA